jgi:hypothetical protein
MASSSSRKHPQKLSAIRDQQQYIKSSFWLTASSSFGSIERGHHHHADGKRERRAVFSQVLCAWHRVHEPVKRSGSASFPAKLTVRGPPSPSRPEGEVARGRGGYLLDSRGGYRLDDHNGRLAQ